MTWSFSRINSFYDGCKREWKKHYIDCDETTDSFDGQAGGFAHEILEKYFKRELTEFELAPYFEEHYSENVTLPCPYPSGDTKYQKMLEYFQNFSFPIDDYEVLGVEKKINFKLKNEYDLVGYIDVLLKNKETGEITLMDHKSSTIKILKNGGISKSDIAHFEAFKRQQLLYSAVVLEEYGRVDYLKWNMFKDGTEITIPWTQKDLDETIDWAYDTIKKIESESDYPANPDYYYCKNLCSIRMNMDCPYKRLGMIYSGIYSKCYSKKNKDYGEYGNVGIELCESWKNDKSEFFDWALKYGGYNDELVLKRYDESGNFDEFNCYWDWREDSYYEK